MNASETLHQVGALLGAVLGDPITASGAGGHFTCTEADNLATALVLTGHADAAATWLYWHSDDDDDYEDSHVVQVDDTEHRAFTPEEARAYVAKLNA